MARSTPGWRASPSPSSPVRAHETTCPSSRKPWLAKAPIFSSSSMSTTCMRVVLPSGACARDGAQRARGYPSVNATGATHLDEVAVPFPHDDDRPPGEIRRSRRRRRTVRRALRWVASRRPEPAKQGWTPRHRRCLARSRGRSRSPGPSPRRRATPVRRRWRASGPPSTRTAAPERTTRAARSSRRREPRASRWQGYWPPSARSARRAREAPAGARARTTASRTDGLRHRALSARGPRG